MASVKVSVSSNGSVGVGVSTRNPFKRLWWRLRRKSRQAAMVAGTAAAVNAANESKKEETAE